MKDLAIIKLTDYYWELYEMFTKAGGGYLSDEGVQAILREARKLTVDYIVNRDIYTGPSEKFPAYLRELTINVKDIVNSITEDEIF